MAFRTGPASSGFFRGLCESAPRAEIDDILNMAWLWSLAGDRVLARGPRIEFSGEVQAGSSGASRENLRWRWI